MSFNDLPDPVIIQIFNDLDDTSKLSAMIAFPRWAEILASSSKLMHQFEMTLNADFFANFSVQELPDIPLQFVSIRSDYTQSKLVLQVLKKYRKSIDFMHFAFRYRKFLVKILKTVDNVQHLALCGVELGALDDAPRLKIADLRTLLIISKKHLARRTLDLFLDCKTVQAIHIDLNFCWQEASSVLFDMMTHFPRLQFVCLMNVGYRFEYRMPPFNFKSKLTTLRISAISAENIPFLRTQRRTLKQVIIYGDNEWKLYITRDMELLRFLVWEMELMLLQYGGFKMIDNYKRQPQADDFYYNHYRAEVDFIFHNSD